LFGGYWKNDECDGDLNYFCCFMAGQGKLVRSFAFIPGPFITRENHFPQKPRALKIRYIEILNRTEIITCFDGPKILGGVSNR